MIDKIINLLSNKVLSVIKDDLGRIIYQAIKSFIESGVFPLTLEKTIGKDLVNYKIEGNTTEVGSVGDKTKNLVADGEVNYNASAIYEPYGNGYKATTEISTGGYTNYISIGTGLTPKWGATYTLSVKLELSDNNMSPLMRLGYWEFNPMLWKDFVNKSVDSNGVHSITFTLPSEQPANYYSELGICLFFNIQRNSTGNTGTLTITDMMLVEGSTTKDYEPSGYVMPIRTGNKNLLNVPDTIVEGTNSWTASSVGDYELAPGEYTISVFYNKLGNDKPTCSLSVREYGNTTPQYCEIAGTKDSGRLTGKFTVPEGSKGIRIYAYSNLTNNVASSKVEFYDFQIEKGAIATDYEPYIVTNIYLNEPLSKGDYIDFARQVIGKNYNGEVIENFIELPSIPTLDGTTILDSDVTVKPSKVEIEYYSTKVVKSVPFVLANGDTFLDSNSDNFNVKEEL